MTDIYDEKAREIVNMADFRGDSRALNEHAKNIATALRQSADDMRERCAGVAKVGWMIAPEPDDGTLRNGDHDMLLSDQIANAIRDLPLSPEPSDEG